MISPTHGSIVGQSTEYRRRTALTRSAITMLLMSVLTLSVVTGCSSHQLSHQAAVIPDPSPSTAGPTLCPGNTPITVSQETVPESVGFAGPVLTATVLTYPSAPGQTSSVRIPPRQWKPLSATLTERKYFGAGSPPKKAVARASWNWYWMYQTASLNLDLLTDVCAAIPIVGHDLAGDVG